MANVADYYQQLQQSRQKKQQQNPNAIYSLTSASTPSTTGSTYSGRDPYQEILYRKQQYESNPTNQDTMNWAHESAQQFYNMLDPAEAEKVNRMNASQLARYIQQRQTQMPTPIDTDRYRTETATIEDLANKWGFDYSRDYANQVAEAAAQQKRDDIAKQKKAVQESLMNSVDSLDRNYFLQGLEQAQNQVNNGLNAGIAADQNLRLAMSRQAALGDVYANTNVQNYDLNAQLARVEQEKLAQAEQLYQDRLQQAFQNAMTFNQFNQQENQAMLQAALSQRSQDMNWAQYLQDLALQQAALTGTYAPPEAQRLIQTVLDAKDAFSKAKTDVERNQARRAADLARQQLAMMGYDTSLIGANVTKANAENALRKMFQTVPLSQWQQQFNESKRQFNTEQEWREYTYKHMSAAEKANFDEMKRQFGEQMAWNFYELEQNMNYYNSAFTGFNSGSKGGDYNIKSLTGGQKVPSSFASDLQTAFKMDNIPASWGPAITELIRRESSWNPRAKNPSSSAYGYAQFLSSTRATYEKKMGINYDNPVNQIRMMVQYIKDRYGTPQNALKFWNEHHWY